MSTHPTHRAIASAATRERLRASVERIAAASLEPHARIGSLLVYGPEGYQSSVLLNEAVEELVGWAVVVGIADENERTTDWAFLEVLNQSLSRFGVQVATPLTAPDVDDDPSAVGRNVSDALASISSPVCLVVEQMHYVDTKSADAIRFGMRRHGEQRQLLLMSSDSLVHPGDPLLEELAQSRPEQNALLRLPPLTPAEAQELAVERVGRPLSGRVARRFVADTDGNPTLVAGLIEAYRSDLENAIHPAAIDLERGRLVPLLPQQQRALDTAPPGARAAAEVIAVLREPAAIAAASRVAAYPGVIEDSGSFDLEAAERAGLVRFVDGADVPTVAPPSNVAADVIASRIPIQRRRRIHEAAAGILTGFPVLRHRVGAMNADDTTLVADLIENARTRVAGNNPDRAMTLAVTALRLAAPGEEYERAMLFAGVLALRLHEHQRLFPLIGDFAGLPESPLRNAILADLEILTGDWTSAVAHATRVVESSGGDATGRVLRGHAATMIPLYDAVHERQELMPSHAAAARPVLAAVPADIGEVDPDLRWMVRSHDNELWLTTWELVAAVRLRDTERVADRMRRLDRLLRQSPDSAAVVDAAVFQARTLAYAGRVTDASNRLHRAVRIGSNFPGAWLRHIALTMHGHLLFLSGEWEKALLNARVALDRALDDPYRAPLPIAYAVAALVPAARGLAAEVHGIDRILGLLPPADDVAIPYDPDLPDVMRAELAAALGDPVAQLRATEAARTASRRGTVWSWLPLHVDALARLGRISEARAIANDALAGRSTWNRTPLAVSRLQARIALAAGELEQAVELYSGIARSHTAATQPFDLARDRVDFAQALLAQGQPRRAADQLEHAASVFRTLKADTYLARTLDQLAELGGATTPGTRQDADDALGALTARERQVAIAVAGGLTNREVAERLFVSVTTVNFHVRNILAKLSLRSRRELRAIVHGGDGEGIAGA